MCPNRKPELRSTDWNQAKTRSSGAHATRLKTRAPEHANHTEKGSSECRRELGVTGGVRRTKDRDVPALEMRAGTPVVGRTSQDAAGFLAAPTETELKWSKELSGEQTMISLF